MPEASLHAEESGVSANVEPHDHSIDQWNALATREGGYAYRRLSPTSCNLSAIERERICLWCYRFVDHLDCDRATAAIALSYFDRFLAAEIIDRAELPLACVTSLCLALKMDPRLDRRIVTCSHVAGFSDGRFAAEDVVNMEKRICEGLGWLLNPPVPDSYLSVITPVLGDKRMIGSSYRSPHRAACDREMREVLHQLVERSRFLCKRSVLDAFFADKSPSSIAYAAVSEALLLMSFPQEAVEWFLSLPLNHNAKETFICAKHFRLVISMDVHRPAVTFSHFYRALLNCMYIWLQQSIGMSLPLQLP